MTDPYLILLVTAFALGTFHTAIGVDHSLPLVVLARTRRWSLQRTLLVTLACGWGHVLSSAAIAGIGLGIGVTGSRLMAVEESRGSWAAWCLVGFGIAYALAGFWHARKRRPHGDNHGDHHPGQRRLIAGLVLIFTLGPCEALLPLLAASGLTLSFVQALLVTAVFSFATMATMLALVTVGYLGSSLLSVRGRWSVFERYSQVIAGLTLALSGVTIQQLGI